MGAKLELEQQVGRLIVGRLPSTTLPDEYKAALAAGTIGGITFFRENAENLSQLASLVGDVLDASLHIPILTVDQEGGAVQRFDRALTPLPSPMALSSANDEELLREVTGISAGQLRRLGLNCLLAPVLDVINNPISPIISTRAFGNSPERVTKYGRIVADTIAAQGLLPTGKHFPGHGACREDSHVALAVNKLSIEEIWKKDLHPFKAILDSLPIILNGHIWVEEIDPTPLPASLSVRITQSILRGYLGFKGLIMTDDMIMKGITNSYGLGEACVMAVEAGADVLLVCGTIEETMTAHSAVVEAVKSGRISKDKLADSLARIKFCFPSRPKSACPDREPKRFSKLEKMIEEGKVASYDASLRGIAALRGGVPDISGQKWTVLCPEHPRYSLPFFDHLKAAFADSARSGKGATELILKRYPLEPTFEDAVAISESLKGENVILLTFRSLIYEDQLRLGQMVADQSAEKIAVCTDTPVDFAGLPDWPNVLATHDPSDQAMRALAEIFLSRNPVGISPLRFDPVPA